MKPIIATPLCVLCLSLALAAPPSPIPPTTLQDWALLVERPEDIPRVLSLATAPAPAPDAPDIGPITPVFTAPGELPHLRILHDGAHYDLPLRHTDVQAELTGFAAAVTVTQCYANPFTFPIEAVYVFPLPEILAVDAMRIKVGDRVIEAEVRNAETPAASTRRPRPPATPPRCSSRSAPTSSPSPSPTSRPAPTSTWSSTTSRPSPTTPARPNSSSPWSSARASSPAPRSTSARAPAASPTPTRSPTPRASPRPSPAPARAPATTSRCR